LSRGAKGKFNALGEKKTSLPPKRRGKGWGGSSYIDITCLQKKNSKWKGGEF